MKTPAEPISTKKALLSSVVYEHCSHKDLTHPQSVGFRSHRARYHYQGDYASLAYEYLTNTQNKAYDPESACTQNDYYEDTGIVMLSLNDQEGVSTATTIPLPDSVAIERAFSEVVNQRRSVRHFTGGAISLSALATLLRFGYGKNFEAKIALLGDCEMCIPMRTVPSAGSLYPLEIYVLALNVEDLPLGLYRYQVDHDVLIQATSRKDALNILDGFKVSDTLLSVDKSSAVILIAARPWKTLRKYGDRGLRYVLQEVGGVSQNIHLSVMGLGIGSVDCSRFYETSVHRSINFDGISNLVLHSILVGIPDATVKR